jgi:hypothetical protein
MKTTTKLERPDDDDGVVGGRSSDLTKATTESEEGLAT